MTLGGHHVWCTWKGIYIYTLQTPFVSWAFVILLLVFVSPLHRSLKYVCQFLEIIMTVFRFLVVIYWFLSNTYHIVKYLDFQMWRCICWLHQSVFPDEDSALPRWVFRFHPVSSSLSDPCGWNRGPGAAQYHHFLYRRFDSVWKFEGDHGFTKDLWRWVLLI